MYARAHMRVHVLYEHNYYVVVRIGARMRAYAHVKIGCVHVRVPDVRTRTCENLDLKLLSRCECCDN